jgi:hypothetical protein
LTPRRVRILRALLAGPHLREQLDRVAGSSNSPDDVAALRHGFGLNLPCQRQPGKDRDGQRCDPGTYRMTDADRERAQGLLLALDSPPGEQP